MLSPAGNRNKPLLLGPIVTTDVSHHSGHLPTDKSSRQPLFQSSNHLPGNSSCDSLHPGHNENRMPGSAVGLSGVASSGSGEIRLEGEWRWNRRDSLGGSGKTDTVATSGGL